MFGLIGSLIYGVVYASAWSYEENKEQSRRQNSKNNSVPFYYDKKGIMRHTSNGKKYTTEEVHVLIHGNKEQEKKERDQKYKQRFDRKYYAVLNPYQHFTQEVFLTYEEAKQYIYNCINDGKSINTEPWEISSAHLDQTQFKYNLHFNRGIENE